MTSIDSGVETSNESNDSSIAYDPRTLEISPIKIFPGVSHVNVMANLCTVNSPSSSSSGLLNYSVDELEGIRFPEPQIPRLEIEPPAGLSFCNLQPACDFGKGYEMSAKNIKNPKRCVRNVRFGNGAIRKWVYSSLTDERRLRYAASTNNDEQVAALLESGVNPNCYDHLLRTPLHVSACRGYSNVVRLLLNRGANPNQRDALDNTPLHLAACTNHVEVVTLLLKAGTDINSNDNYGRNPLQLAQSKLKLLQRGSNNEEALKIKEEVQKVIEMMYTFLHKKGQDSEAELLNAFQTRLTISQTKEEVETGVRDLLANLDNLNLNKSEA